MSQGTPLLGPELRTDAASAFGRGERPRLVEEEPEGDGRPVTYGPQRCHGHLRRTALERCDDAFANLSQRLGLEAHPAGVLEEATNLLAAGELPLQPVE